MLVSRASSVCLVGIGFLFLIGCKPEDETTPASNNPVQEPSQPIPNQVAKVGVGSKGASLEAISDSNPSKMIASPATAYFRTKEKIVFEIQLPHTMNAFYALNGRYPKSHEEYMREIVQQIKLPQLPQGMIYRYHPESHELWVEAENNPQGSTAKEDGNGSYPSSSND